MLGFILYCQYGRYTIYCKLKRIIYKYLILIKYLGTLLCESLSTDVLHLTLSSACVSQVRKKACLCLRRVLQVNSELISPDEIVPRLNVYVFVIKGILVNDII